MRTVTVKDNQIVVEVNGAKVRYPLEIVRKRISSLLQDLETWREYERLLTPLAVDGATPEGFCECGTSIEHHTGMGCLYRPATKA